MGEVTVLKPSLPAFSGKQLELIRKTVAKDANEDEFNMFIEVAKSRGLNPFLKQIYCFIFSKDDPKKRNMSIVTGIDGFRIIAARCRDYRPNDAPTDFTTDEAKVSPSNPEGIIKAVVYGYKFGPDGHWARVAGEAWWDEMAPLKDTSPTGFDWVETGEVWEDSGKAKKKKVPKAGAEIVRVPDGNWATMPRRMLEKCAEAAMLRKGWPEDFSGIYVSEEMDRARTIDLTATEMVAAYEKDKRLQLTGGRDSIFVQWAPDRPLEAVPLGKFADRASEFVQSCASLPDLEGWKDTNRVALQDFWARAKSDALGLKEVIEKREKAIAQANAA